MPNPWTKKNPMLSLFLSGANAAASHGRGLLLRQARTNRTIAIRSATQAWIDLWTPKPTRKRKSTK
jgi:hypothetical protein